jgi:hypothetical protein
MVSLDGINETRINNHEYNKNKGTQQRSAIFGVYEIHTPSYNAQPTPWDMVDGFRAVSDE